MSTKYAELVRAESEPDDDENAGAGDEETDADTETDENDTGDDDEETEPAEGLAAIGETELRKAERATEAQRRKLAGILGEAYVAHECLFCAALGFTPEPPPVGATFAIVETEDGIGIAVQPPAPDIPLLEAPDKARCDECDGWGEVLSGSRAAHGMVTPCSKCSGNGWVLQARAEPLQPAGVTVTLPPPMAVPTFSPNGAPDAWGRPAGHAHYGRAPADIPG